MQITCFSRTVSWLPPSGLSGAIGRAAQWPDSWPRSPKVAEALGELEQALANVGDAQDVELHFQPFELNPHMPPGGQDITEHLTQKYGTTPEQQTAIREAIFNRQHLISGGQPVGVFEDVLRQLASGALD